MPKSPGPGQQPLQDQPRVLAFSNLYRIPGLEDSPFNRQQLDALARLCPLSLVVPVPFTMALPKLKFSLPARRLPYPVRWPFFWFLPKILPQLRGEALFASAWPALKRAALALDPQVFYATWAHPCGWAGMKAARAMNLPFVLKVHGSDLNELPQDPRVARSIEKALAAAARVVAVSGQLADKAAELGADPAKVVVIGNGVDFARFHPRDRQKARAALGLPQNGQVVLFLGRLAHVKGLDLGLRAMALCRNDFHLAVVGAGEEEHRCRGLASELGLAGRVTWLGARQHEQVPLCYAAASALVLPSRSEGEPNAVLEALASGAPVAANPVGSAPQLVRDGRNGFVAAEVSPEALAQALDQVTGRDWQPGEVAESIAGRSWSASADRLLEVLQGAAAGAKP